MRPRVWISRVYSILFISGILVAGWAQYSPVRVRTVLNLNNGWKFIKSATVTGAQATSFSDASWSTVNLPHSFDIPYFRANKAVAPYVGWYRRHITVPQQAITAGKRYSLEFEAAFIVSTVWVNGDSVGQHRGGYTGFAYDITPYLTAGDNVIAVKVDGSWQHNLAPRGGDYCFIGGIYRNVSIEVTEPLHVAWYGTFVTTPSVSSSSATVRVRTEVVNASTASQNCSITSVVVDANGNSVASATSSAVTVPAGTIDTFVQVLPSIASPNLWSPSTPYLYTIYTQVSNGLQIVDNYSSPFGIRTIAWSASTGFSLNGQRLWLQGADVHQTHAGWGDAATDAGSVRDVKMIHDCGMNFIRGSHYPHNPAFVAACDRLGVCFWSEMCLWCSTTGGDTTNWEEDGYPTSAADTAVFNTNVLQQLNDEIKIYRNNPSIIVWSMCNEPFFSGQEAKIKALLARMVALTHLQDSTRPAAIGGCQRDGSLSPAYYKIGDVAGFNGDGATIAEYQNCGVPSAVTEYGSCSANRPGNYNACWGSVQTTNDSANEYAWRAGVTLWCGFHYGDATGYGTTGMIDHARLPLETWYYYRNKYLKIGPPTWPASGTAAKLAITVDHDTITDDGKNDAQVIVQIQNASGTLLSNTANITLTDNSGLGIFPSANAGGTSISFTAGAIDQGVEVGECAIEYRAYNAGTATITASSSGLTSATQTIVINHVVDSSIVYLATGVLGRKLAPTLQIVRQVRFVGNTLMVPQEFRGKVCSIQIFTLQGKLVKEMELKRYASSIKLRGMGTAAMIAHFTSH